MMHLFTVAVATLCAYIVDLSHAHPPQQRLVSGVPMGHVTTKISHVSHRGPIRPIPMRPIRPPVSKVLVKPVNVVGDIHQNLGIGLGVGLGRGLGAMDPYTLGLQHGAAKGYALGKGAGYKHGQIEGYVKGKVSGVSKGLQAGYHKGRVQGYYTGKSQGLKRGASYGYLKGNAQGISSGQRIGYTAGLTSASRLNNAMRATRISHVGTMGGPGMLPVRQGHGLGVHDVYGRGLGGSRVSMGIRQSTGIRGGQTGYTSIQHNRIQHQTPYFY